VRIPKCELRGSLSSTIEIRHSPVPASLDYDAFGRIYEYFLAPWESVAAPTVSGPVQDSPTGRGEFAMSEGQGGGEFYTPSSIVRLLTEVIEPYYGRILDPACGSGGMFVSSARFVSSHKRQVAAGNANAMNAFNSFN
jgi:type I restriction enzyme M protein